MHHIWEQLFHWLIIFFQAERAQGVRGGGGGEDDESGEEVSGEATEQEVALFVDIGVMALKDVKDVEMQTANPPLLQKGFRTTFLIN